MSSSFLKSEFVADVRRRGRLPTSAESWSEADILALANDEIQTDIVPLVLSVREEYLDVTEDTALVLGTSAYAIPTDAVGRQVRLVRFSSDGTTFQNLTRIELEQEETLGTGYGTPVGFKVEGNNLVLLPVSAMMAGTLRITYPKAPDQSAVDDAENPVFDSSVPLELIPYLVQRVVALIWQSEGDPKAEGAWNYASRLREQALKLITPRAVGNHRVVVNRDGPGFAGRRGAWKGVGGGGSSGGGLF